MADNMADNMECQCITDKEIWLAGEEDIYWKQSLPDSIRRIQVEVETVVEGYDYPGSLIYDESVDQVLLRKLEQDLITALNGELDTPSGDEVIGALLYFEIYRRRMVQKHYQTFGCK